MKYLIAGLGNIGSEYEQTRHNIGFDILDRLAEKQEVNFKLDRQAFFTSFKFKGRTFCLIKPTTYMNLSGKAIRYWLNELKIPIENLLVITDDINLPLGKIRIRKKGSDGGHNGLKDIQLTMGTNEYSRLRFGAGDDFSKGKQVDHVLSKWKENEQPELNTLIENCVDAITSFGTIGIDRTMNEFNNK